MPSSATKRSSTLAVGAGAARQPDSRRRTAAGKAARNTSGNGGGPPLTPVVKPTKALRQTTHGHQRVHVTTSPSAPPFGLYPTSAQPGLLPFTLVGEVSPWASSVRTSS